MSAVVVAETSAAGSSSQLKARPRSKVSTSKKSKRPPLGKLLGASDKDIREAAVETLLDFLSGESNEEGSEPEDAGNESSEEAETDFEKDWDTVKLPKAFREDQMKIIWQGCFYCMYMCDKPLPQQKLANQLALPIVTIANNPQLKTKTARVKAAVIYLSTFWFTMLSKWSGIDKYRVDKYYSLMRRVMCATFKLLRSVRWNPKVVEEVRSILVKEGGPLHLQDVKTPVSIGYHVIDVYLEELDRALEPADGKDSEDVSTEEPQPPILLLLQPIIDAATTAINKGTFQRVTSNVFDPLLEATRSTDNEPASKRRKTALDGPSYHNLLRQQDAGLDKVILKALFEQGAKETTEEVNRRRLYTYVSSKGYAGDDDE